MILLSLFFTEQKLSVGLKGLNLQTPVQVGEYTKRPQLSSWKNRTGQ